MKINRVQIENFMGFRQVDVELPVGPVFILGENRDQQSQGSNGSGKSAFIEAVLWCLFDSVRTATLKDEVIHSGQEYALVRVEVEHEENIIEVTRTRNHPDHGSGAQLLVNGEEQDQHKEADTVRSIERYIGITAKAFFNAAISSNPTVNPPFVSLTPAKMLEVVSKILDIDRFDEYSRRAKDYRADSADDVTDKTATHRTMVNHVDFLKDKIDETVASIELFDIQQKAELDALTERRDKHQATVDELVTEIAEFDSLVEEYNTFDQSGLLRYDANIRLLQDVATRETAALVVAKQAQGRLQEEENKAQELRNQRDNLTKSDTGECDYCGSLLSQSKRLLEKVTQYDGKLEGAESEVVDMQADLLKKNSEYQDLRRRHIEIQGEQDELQAVHDRYATLKKTVAAVGVLQSQLELATGKLNGVLDQMKLVKKQSVSQLNEHLVKMEADLVRALDDVDRLGDEMEVALIDYDAADLLAKAFKQIKVGVMNGFVAELLQQVNYNLDQFTEGDFNAEVQLKNNGLQLLFSNSEKVGPRRYGALSRGEQVRVAKAVQVAVAQVAGATTLIEDEGFSGLDPAGVEPIIDFMLQAGMVNLLFVSHATVVADYLADYPTLKIVKENDVATAEVV